MPPQVDRNRPDYGVAFGFCLIGLIIAGYGIKASLCHHPLLAGQSGVDWFDRLSPLLNLFEISFGCLFLGAGLYAARAEWSQSKLRQLSPDEPWLWIKEWKNGRIRSSSLPMALLETFFTAGLNLFLLIVVFALSSQYLFTEKGFNGLVMLALLTSLLGSLFTIRHTIRTWRHTLKYGSVIFHMTHVPGEIGGSLAGVITLTPRKHPQHDLELILSCNRSFNDTEETLWKEACPAPIPDAPGEVRIPVFFRIPAECESTKESEIIWRLELKERPDNEDPIATFIVPVFY